MIHDSTSADSTTPGTPKSVAAYMAIKGASEAIDFYKKAFGAVEEFRLSNPDGKVAHAEIRIGATAIMLADEWPDFGAVGPITIGGSPVKFTIEVEDADAAFAHAVENGCSELRGLEDQFYGYRGGMVTDPFGYSWFIQAKTEDVDAEEMQARWMKVQADM